MASAVQVGAYQTYSIRWDVQCQCLLHKVVEALVTMVCLLTTFQEETIGCTDGKCCNLKKKKNNLNFTNNDYLFIFFRQLLKETQISQLSLQCRNLVLLSYKNYPWTGMTIWHKSPPQIRDQGWVKVCAHRSPHSTKNKTQEDWGSSWCCG